MKMITKTNMRLMALSVSPYIYIYIVVAIAVALKGELEISGRIAQNRKGGQGQREGAVQNTTNPMPPFESNAA